MTNHERYFEKWDEWERQGDSKYVFDREYGQPGEDVNSFRGDNVPECHHKHDIRDPKCKESFIELVERLREQKS